MLAVDQTFKQDKDTKTVIGKTATLEVTPAQAEQVAKAQNQGTLSLSLRPLVSSDPSMASNTPAPTSGRSGSDEGGEQVSIIRYGIARDTSLAVQGGAKPQ